MKIKITAFAIALILLTSSVLAVRLISSSSDNIYTMIRNSKGNCWEATPSNIQLAIDDLEPEGGTVWLPGVKTFNITDTVVVKENVILDLGGSSLKLSPGINITMVELKNKAGIKNGVIDVAGHVTWHNSYTSFIQPHSCIFLNATSQIESALIENMALESIGLGYNESDYYSDNYSGRGYGIHLYAGNYSVPQKISGVVVRDSYFRAFANAILIQNDRDPKGNEPGAYIEGNTFEYLWFYGNEISLNISRNTNAPKENCSVSGNVFNMIQFQTGTESWWGGEQITHRAIVADGSNVFTNIIAWDPANIRHTDGQLCQDVAGWPCFQVEFTSDSESNYIIGRCGLSNDTDSYGKIINNGANNTRFSTDFGILNISSLDVGGFLNYMDTYVVPTMTDDHILPDLPVPSGYLSNQISVRASSGEFEPASFVLKPDYDMTGLEIEATDLTGNGTIDSENVDVSVVKVWYQAGIGVSDPYYNKYIKILTPELLLKDDSLVKVENGENYVKFTNGTYAWISNVSNYSGQLSYSIQDFPVRDNNTLQPFNLTADKNKQFWVTVKVPENANFGNYTGVIKIKNSTETFEQINLKLEVLPINLSKPYLIYSLYYHGQFNPSYPNGTIGSYSKSQEQYEAEIQDMMDHGLTNPSMYQNYNLGQSSLGQALAARGNLSLVNIPLYYFGLGPSGYQDPEDVEEVINFTQNYNVTQVYFYGEDEAQGQELLDQRDSWTAIKAAGGKMFVACCCNAYDLVGDLLDIAVFSGQPSSEEAAKWHSQNHSIFSYGNPQTGMERPETYRRNYGLLLWQNDYDGAMDFAYNYQFWTIWNDFDHNTYREEVFAYPTINGVIDTIQWEGWREGVDDVRYLTTLMEKMEEVNGTMNVTSAEDWLSYIKNSNLESMDLDDIRSKMIDFILYFSGKGPEPGWCGNNLTETGEECDGSDLNEMDCTDFGYTGGNLGCTDGCEITMCSCEPHNLSVSFVPPTDNDAKTVNRSWTFVNATVQSDCEAMTSFINWNESLVGYWKFDESSGQTVYDSSGKGNNGTLKYENLTSTADLPDTNATQCADDDTLLVGSVWNGFYSGWHFEATSGLSAGNSTTITGYTYVNSSYRVLYFQDALPGFAQGDSYKLWYDLQGPDFIEGKFGHALEFDGRNDYLEILDSSVLEGFDSVTLELWSYQTGGYNDQGILGDDWITLRASDGASLYLYNSSGGGSGYIGQVDLTKGSWHHIVVTYDKNQPSDNMKFYVDGNLQSYKNFSGSLRSGGSSLKISTKPGSAKLWEGKIDEVRIWKRVLSEEEIMASYNSCNYGLYHNFTSLANGNYQYYASVADGSGNYTQTETRTITVNT